MTTQRSADKRYEKKKRDAMHAQLRRDVEAMREGERAVLPERSVDELYHMRCWP